MDCDLPDDMLSRATPAGTNGVGKIMIAGKSVGVVREGGMLASTGGVDMPCVVVTE